MITLVLPDKIHKSAVERYKNQMIEANSSMDGTSDLANLTFEDWFYACENYRLGKNMRAGYVRATQFLAIRSSDQKLIGMLNIRHELNDFLKHVGGHIGYSVAPNERRKGYATEMLRLGLIECKKLNLNKVLISCKKHNIGSSKVIEKNGGTFYETVEFNNDIFNKYRINI